MKFGKTFEDSQKEGWSSHYMGYNILKAILKETKETTNKRELSTIEEKFMKQVSCF